MADAETEVLANGTGGLSAEEDDERMKQRPADIDADVREMERRKRVEAIMSSKLFREELERVLDQQLHEGAGGGGAGPLLQRITEMVGGVRLQSASNRGANCVLPINDIRGMEGVGYEKGEKILRCKLAAVYRLVDLYGWTQGGVCGQITARLNTAVDQLLTAPRGILPHEVTASSLMKADMLGAVIDQGTTNFPMNLSGFSVHAAVHGARPDIRCIIHMRSPAALAVSAQRAGLLPLCTEAALLGDIAYHRVPPGVLENEERDRMVRALGPTAKVVMLANGGALCCGETLEEAFHHARCAAAACDVQLKLAALPPDALTLIDDDTRRQIYEESRKPPAEGGKWRVGGEDLEALMRMLDNAGFRTGYIYRHPLVKGDVPKPKNDVEVPPAVSSLGYLLEEEEMYRQGLWKKGALKGGDRTRWLNSPNVYQKVEVLETGTSDPKKITKWVDANNEEWVQDGSPAHSSTPVRIDAALQFVPKGTNPKEFKKLQQQIKDNRRADLISAGPQSHILEGVTWDEANKLSEDANVTQTGDHVVLMGAASKGIIQRGYQHNATVYSAPYARNPFDNVSDTELQEYRRQVQRKQRPDYDTDLSESEAIVSGQITSPAETEEESRDEHRVLRIETKQAPKASQPEIVLSDESMSEFLNAERRAADRSFRDPSALSEREAFGDASASAVSDASVSVSVRRTSEAVVVRSYRTPAQQTVVRDANHDPISTVTHQFARPYSNPVFLTSNRTVHDFSRINNFGVIAKKFDCNNEVIEKNRKDSKSSVDVRSRSNGNVSDDNFVDTISVCSVGVQSGGCIELKRDKDMLSNKVIASNELTNGNDVKSNTNDIHYSDSASNPYSLKRCCSTNDIATSIRTGSSCDDFYIDCKRTRGEMNFSSKDPPKHTMSSKCNLANDNKKGSKCKLSLCDKYSNEVVRADALDLMSDRSSYSSVMSCDWDLRDFVFKTRSLPRVKRSNRSDGLYRTNSHSGLVNGYLKDPEPNHFHLPKCKSCGAFNSNYMWEVTRDKLLAERSNAPVRRYSESDNNQSIINGRNYCTLRKQASKSVGEMNNSAIRTINVTHFIVPKHKVEKVLIGGQEFVESQEFTEDCYYDDIANSFSSQNQTIIERNPEERTVMNKVSHEKFKKPVESDSFNNVLDELTKKQNSDVEGASDYEKKPKNNFTDHAIQGEYLNFSDELDFDSTTYESPVRDLVQKDIRNYSVPIALYCDDFKGENNVTLTSSSIIFSPSKMAKGTLEPIIEESKSSYGDDSNSFESDKDKKIEETAAISELKHCEKITDHCNNAENGIELKKAFIKSNSLFDKKISPVVEKKYDSVVARDESDGLRSSPHNVQESTDSDIPEITIANSISKDCVYSDQINDKVVTNTLTKLCESLPVCVCENSLMTNLSQCDQTSQFSSTLEFERLELAIEVMNDVLDKLSFQEYINTTDGFENVEAACDVMNCVLKRLSCDINHNYSLGLRNSVTDSVGSHALERNYSDLEATKTQDVENNLKHDNDLDTSHNVFEYIKLILNTLVDYVFQWIDQKLSTSELVKSPVQNVIFDCIQRSNFENFSIEQNKYFDNCTFLGCKNTNDNINKKNIIDMNAKLHRIELNEKELELSVLTKENLRETDQPLEIIEENADKIIKIIKDRHQLETLHVKVIESSINNHNQLNTSVWTKSNENMVEKFKLLSDPSNETIYGLQNNKPSYDIDIYEEQLPDTVRSVVNFVISQTYENNDVPSNFEHKKEVKETNVDESIDELLKLCSLDYTDDSNNNCKENRKENYQNCHFNYQQQSGKRNVENHDDNKFDNCDDKLIFLNMKKQSDEKNVCIKISEPHDEIYMCNALSEKGIPHDSKKVPESFEKYSDRFVVCGIKASDSKFDSVNAIDRQLVEGSAGEETFTDTEQNNIHDVVSCNDAVSSFNDTKKLPHEATICMQLINQDDETYIRDVPINVKEIGNRNGRYQQLRLNGDKDTPAAISKAVDQFYSYDVATADDIQNHFNDSDQLQNEKSLQDTYIGNSRSYDQHYVSDVAACNDQLIINQMPNKNSIVEFSEDENDDISRSNNENIIKDDKEASKLVNQFVETGSNGVLNSSQAINILVETCTVNGYSSSFGKISNSKDNVRIEGDSESSTIFFESKPEIIVTKDYESDKMKDECSFDETKANGSPQGVKKKYNSSFSDMEEQTIQELDDILNKAYDENDLSDVATQDNKNDSTKHDELEKNKPSNTAYNDVLEKTNCTNNNLNNLDVVFEANCLLETNINVAKSIFDGILDKTFSYSATSRDSEANDSIMGFDDIINTSKLLRQTKMITNETINAKYLHDSSGTCSEETTTADTNTNNVKDLGDGMNLAFLEDSILLRSMEETNNSENDNLENQILLNTMQSEDCRLKTTSSPINRNFPLRNDSDDSLIASPIEVSQSTFRRNLFKSREIYNKKTESKSSPSINKSAVFAMSQIQQPGGLKFWVSFDDTSIYDNDRKYDTFPISRKCKTRGNLENKTPSFLNVRLFDEPQNIRQEVATNKNNCMKHNLVRNTRSVTEISLNDIYLDASESVDKKQYIMKEIDMNAVLNKNMSENNYFLTNDSINSLEVNVSRPSNKNDIAQSEMNSKANFDDSETRGMGKDINEINNNCVSEVAYDSLDINGSLEISDILKGDINVNCQVDGDESEISINHSIVRAIPSITVETCNGSYLNDNSSLTTDISNHNVSLITISDDSFYDLMLLEHLPEDADSSENFESDLTINTPIFHNIPMSEIYSPLTTTPTHWGKYELETNYYERRPILCQGLLGKPDKYSFHSSLSDLNASIDQLSYVSCGSKSESFSSCKNFGLPRDAYIYGKDDMLSDSSLAAFIIETSNSNEDKERQINSSKDGNIGNRNLATEDTADNGTTSDDNSSELTCTTVVTVINAKILGKEDAKTKLLFDTSKMHPYIKEINYRRNAYSWPSLDHAFYYTIPTHFQKSESLEIDS